MLPRQGQPALRSFRFVFGAMTNRYQENGALAFRVGRKKARNVVVEQSEPSRAEALGIGAEVQLTAKNAGFELHRAIAAIAEALQNGPQVPEDKNVHGRVAAPLLSQPHAPRLRT